MFVSLPTQSGNISPHHSWTMGLCYELSSRCRCLHICCYVSFGYTPPLSAWPQWSEELYSSPVAKSPGASSGACCRSFAWFRRLIRMPPVGALFLWRFSRHILQAGKPRGRPRTHRRANIWCGWGMPQDPTRRGWKRIWTVFACCWVVVLRSRMCQDHHLNI